MNKVMCKGDIRLGSGCKACERCYSQLEEQSRAALLEAEAALEVATGRDGHPKPFGQFKSSETLGLELVRAALASKPFEGTVSFGLKKLLDEMGTYHHDTVTAMQAAWIEWQHGAGAEEAMGWIHNTLCGPGHIPDEDEPWGKEAQAWFDANRSNPAPACPCGRPGNIRSSDKAYCSENCYRTAKGLPLLESKPAELGERVKQVRDAERWRMVEQVVCGLTVLGNPIYAITGKNVEMPENLMRGSVAEHLTKSIDAKIAAEKAAMAREAAQEAASHE